MCMTATYTPIIALFVTVKPDTVKVLHCCYFCRLGSTLSSELMNNYPVSCLSGLLFMFSLVSDGERRRGRKAEDRY